MKAPTSLECHRKAQYWLKQLLFALTRRRPSKAHLRWARHCAAQYRQWCDLL